MKKRQRKKNQKRYLPIYADEFNLTTMSEEERKKAWEDYLKFREQHAYCKTYRELKEFNKTNKQKMLFYQFPAGEEMSNYLQKISSIRRQSPKQSLVVTQSLTEDEKTKLKDIINKSS